MDGLKKIQKKVRRKLLGVYILLIGILLLVKFMMNITLLYVFVGLLLLPGIELIMGVIIYKRSKKLLIPGITLLGTSLFLLFYLLFSRELQGLLKFWPVIGISPAIGLIVYYFTTGSKNPATIIPGVFILLMCIILMFFSLGVFSFSFKDFILISVPVIIILFGIFIIIYPGKKFDNQSNRNENI